MLKKKKEMVELNSTEDMRGLFMVVKGHYKKSGMLWKCSDGVERYLGGYDPEDDSNEEWYQLMDKVNYVTVSCGSDLTRILEGAKNLIVKYKNDRTLYLSKHQKNDSYEDEGGKKNKRVLVSPTTASLMEGVREHYSWYYDDMLAKYEDMAIKELSSTDSKKTITAPKKSLVKKTTPAKEKPVEKTTEKPKKTIQKKTTPVKPVVRKKESSIKFHII